MNITPNKEEPKQTRLEFLQEKQEENRAQHVSDVFEIYDKIPVLLAEFKEEGISEDVMVRRLGVLIEKIFVGFEMTQVPIIFEILKEKKQSRVVAEQVAAACAIVTPDGLPSSVVTSADANRIIVP